MWFFCSLPREGIYNIILLSCKNIQGYTILLNYGKLKIKNISNGKNILPHFFLQPRICATSMCIKMEVDNDILSLSTLSERIFVMAVCLEICLASHNHLNTIKKTDKSNLDSLPAWRCEFSSENNRVHAKPSHQEKTC